MTALRWSQRALLAKVEDAYGADATPGAAHAVLAKEIEITPLAGESAERELIRPHFGGGERVHVGAHATCKFTVELAASGTAGAAPAWGILLRGCGMDETLMTANAKSVTYAPVSADEESITLHFYLDGQRHAITGARGTFSIGVEAQAVPTVAFEFTGLWAAPGSVAMPEADFSAWRAPTAAGFAATTGFSLLGASPALASLSYEHGNQVVHRELVGGSAEAIITGREPKASVTIEAAAISSKDWFSAARNGDVGALSVTHGTKAGEKIALSIPKAQPLAPSYAEADGVAMLEIELAALPGDGDDEVKIAIT